jgi:integrase
VAKIVKGEDRGRPGKWIVDYRDAGNSRRWKTCDSKSEAQIELSKILGSTNQAGCQWSPSTTFKQYAEWWIQNIVGRIKPQTALNYRFYLDNHIYHWLGHAKVRKITPGFLIDGLTAKKREELAAQTVKIIIRGVISGILSKAKLDGLIASNPAQGIAKELKFTETVEELEEENLKAFTFEQRAAFLTAAESYNLFPLYQLLASSGCRIGEAIALHIEDVDLESCKVRINKTFYKGVVGTPKTSEIRTVDISDKCAAVLRRHIITVKEYCLKNGRKVQLLFPGETPSGHIHWSYPTICFKQILRRAGLPAHFSPHSLRHTWATLSLVLGEPIQYVQQQLGHASIKVTVDVYGKWVKLTSNGASNKLDETQAGRVVVK